MHLNPVVRHRARGLTLVELMITIALLAILLMLGIPEFNSWIQNTRVRSVTEGFQNGIRLAQAEAVRRNRTVVFFLTNQEPAIGAAAAANGINWGIRTVPSLVGEAAEFVRGSAMADTSPGVTVTGPAALCFNSAGQQVTIAAQNCAAAATNFNIARAGAERNLRITVSLGGRVRMCDPNKVLSNANPDGC